VRGHPSDREIELLRINDIKHLGIQIGIHTKFASLSARLITLKYPIVVGDKVNDTPNIKVTHQQNQGEQFAPGYSLYVTR